MNTFKLETPFDCSSIWPKSTNICCYYCNHKFKSKPLCMPETYDEKKESFTVFGVFCSWGCMKSYNNELNDAKSVFRSNLIYLLHGLITNSYKDIKASPPKYALKCYGGKMSIEEFRKITNEGVYNYQMLLPPLTPINPLIDKNINFTWVSSDEATKSYENFNGNEIQNDQLKIKRDKKPTKNSQNTLEESMGIKL